MHLPVCLYYVTLVLGESTLCSCLNVNKLLAPKRRDIGSLSGCSGIGTRNYVVRKRTLNHLAKLAI